MKLILYNVLEKELAPDLTSTTVLSHVNYI